MRLHPLVEGKLSTYFEGPPYSVGLAYSTFTSAFPISERTRLIDYTLDVPPAKVNTYLEDKINAMNLFQIIRSMR